MTEEEFLLLRGMCDEFGLECKLIVVGGKLPLPRRYQPLLVVRCVFNHPSNPYFKLTSNHIPKPESLVGFALKCMF